MRYQRWMLLVSVAFLLAAWAAQDPLRLELSSYRVASMVDEKGVRTEVYQPAGEAAPGDVLEWRLMAENRSEETLEDVALVIPVPSGTVYVPGSARTLNLNGVTVAPEFSFDGGVHFAHPPLFKRIFVEKDGLRKAVEVEVGPEEYTHVRWTLPALPAGAGLTVAFRTRVKP